MKLIVIHYHLRPGGIRRVIELATPHLARQLGCDEPTVLACGEAGDLHWNKAFERLMRPWAVHIRIEPSFRYLSEQRGSARRIARRTAAALEKLLDDSSAHNGLVWAHNLGLGRNLILSRELVRACESRGVPLVSHHHDWWFDNRWLRWREMRRGGFRTLAAVARTVFAGTPRFRHIAINGADAAILKRHFPGRVGWLPNPVEPAALPSPARTSNARRWLQRKLSERGAPVWVVPCRLLRRKNVAEAILLSRWLRPEAWLVTTGGVSSADEMPYCRKLEAAVRRHRWRVCLGVLQGDDERKPGVAELLAVSECVMLTSTQEGFGLPCLEAAAAQRPLIARALPNIAPDLKKFGFRFPHYYSEVLVTAGLFDWRAEQRRQEALFRRWKAQLLPSCRRWLAEPPFLSHNHPVPVPFSRLTLTAQLEVLAAPIAESWSICAPLNPFLEDWRSRAAAGRLRITPWPRRAAAWLSGSVYAERFHQTVLSRPQDRRRNAPRAQEDFIREKLGAENLFPLLWSRRS